jgi:hypothetical protein
MTVQSEVSKAGPFTGNGVQTVFPFGFRVFTGTEVSVYINGLLQETGYSVSLETIGGSVTLGTPLASGSILVILRNVAFNQLTDLEDGQAFFPEVLERAYDKLTMQTQQLKESVSRAIVIPPDGTEPTPAELLASIAEAETNAANSADAAAISETNAANSASAAAISETNAANSADAAADSAEEAHALATTALRPIFEIFFSSSLETPPGAYPLWTGETIVNCNNLYPDFWAKALELRTAGKIRVLTTSAYNAEVLEYGGTGGFVIDEVAGSIQLPKITEFIQAFDQTAYNGLPYLYQAALGSATALFGSVRLPLYIQVYTAAIPASTAQMGEIVNAIGHKAATDLSNATVSLTRLSMPDIAGAVEKTANTLYQAESDGWISAEYTSVAGGVTVYADSGSTVAYASSGTETAARGCYLLPVAKGAYWKAAVNAASVLFFPCKGLGGVGAELAPKYLYVAYASDASGTDFSFTPSDALKYRAEIHPAEEILSPAASDFADADWVKYLGEDGEQGPQGIQGEQGPRGESGEVRDFAMLTTSGAYTPAWSDGDFHHGTLTGNMTLSAPTTIPGSGQALMVEVVCGSYTLTVGLDAYTGKTMLITYYRSGESVRLMTREVV